MKRYSIIAMMCLFLTASVWAQNDKIELKKNDKKIELKKRKPEEKTEKLQVKLKKPVKKHRKTKKIIIK